MKKTDYTDPLSMYRSGKTAKVVTEQELADQKAKREWTHQLNFCKWLKQTHPEIRFRSDVQSAGKLSAQMQNIMQILDPWKSWPDVQIYLPKNRFIGLHIEIKRIDSGTFLKDGSLSQSKHVQEQAEFHDWLRSIGYKVEFAEGFEQAKKVLESYLNPPIPKKSRCCGRCDGVHDICVGDMICEDHNVMGCEICYGER